MRHSFVLASFSTCMEDAILQVHAIHMVEALPVSLSQRFLVTCRARLSARLKMSTVVLVSIVSSRDHSKVLQIRWKLTKIAESLLKVDPWISGCLVGHLDPTGCMHPVIWGISSGGSKRSDRQRRSLRCL